MCDLGGCKPVSSPLHRNGMRGTTEVSSTEEKKMRQKEPTSLGGMGRNNEEVAESSYPRNCVERAPTSSLFACCDRT